MSDVRGHDALLPAIVVAAAGGHNLFLHGPPGTGKTMIARRRPVDPAAAHARGGDRGHAHPLDRGPALGRRAGRGAPVPRAAPHDLAAPAWSAAARCRCRARSRSRTTACCSSTSCRSSRARRSRRCASRSRTAASRSSARQRVMLFPTRCMLVAASNPCPCGLGDHRCRCSAADLARHQRRLSGPLLDRIDVTRRRRPPGRRRRCASSARPARRSLREQVVAARERQSAPLRRPRRRLQRADDAADGARAGRRRPRARCACSTSSTTATASAPAATTACSASPARPPTSRARDVVGPEHVTAALAAPRPDAAAELGVAASSACDACLRRTDLIVGARRVASTSRGASAGDGPSRVLALPDEELLALDARARSRATRRSAAAFARRRDRRRRPRPPSAAASPATPTALRELPDPPAVLHVAGSPAALPAGEAVAIVGARRATPLRARGRALARPRPGRAPACRSCPGMALGIDSAAHLGALEATPAAPPVAVLAGGAETAYPARMRAPARRG